MLIKEAAKKLNTTARTIRLYEEKGLISLKKDQENDYRIFTEDDLYRLSTIIALREIGIQISEIREMLKQPGMQMEDYLNLQRSVLYEKLLEMKDMIHTIDQMMEHVDSADFQPISKLAEHLKKLKQIRKGWKDKWDFDSQAIEYDQHIKKAGYTFNVHQGYDVALSTVEQCITLNAKDQCLDIGVGTGNLGGRFLHQGAHVIGVDQSGKMLEKCKEKYPLMEVRKGHFLALPVMDLTMDVVVSSYALHHLPDEEKLLALQEINRVLKSGGQLCIADLMFQNENDRKRVLDMYRLEGNMEAVEAIEDEYYADRSLLIEWLVAHDYEVKAQQINSILSVIYAEK
ncbi:methyltransferase domain-containing protein [Virgibacillus halodenitrificans]|uniref:HTH merR-type domain-containing protein n=2 Tax=Virgibacillus halodenitrificans TaxID=1482 RepID=A0AAC9NMB5_VIRHA|nr:MULTISPECIES: methyltransferase domain-containing protein [Virgibacillus]AIF44781.1 transcriptional regulator [Virgibacillus sp. SK37]APC49868.1 hypothetical protein BME96_17430 [Virgibacillus halodenitrificans]MCG1029140.1 methyltransferase domain-containing protein [Virgibacillus halodenitrificans]MCJ0932749.1 MerR family transcriptional regulator [Virgibacillus halodenitrificans]MEC2157896.1 methyltransferase domain-containing protein [Virgibacillus halodenitrificans]